MSEQIRNTDPLDFRSECEGESTSWQRANPTDADIHRLHRFGWVVRLPDSDDGHEVALAQEAGHWTGRCTCPGYKHHDGPCAHLCTLRKAHFIGEIEVAEVSEAIHEHTCPFCGDELGDDSL